MSTRIMAKHHSACSPGAARAWSTSLSLHSFHIRHLGTTVAPRASPGAGGKWVELILTNSTYRRVVRISLYTMETKLLPPTKAHARQRRPRRGNAHRRDRHTRRTARDCDRTVQPAPTRDTHHANCSLQLARTTHCTAHAHFCILHTTSVS